MEFLTYLVDFILHIDTHLFELVEQYGMWIYAILFIIVFCETGLVVTPFLPGDSLLFASGVVAGAGRTRGGRPAGSVAAGRARVAARRPGLDRRIGCRTGWA